MKKHHILCIHGIGVHEDDWVRGQGGEPQSFEELFKEKFLDPNRYRLGKSSERVLSRLGCHMW